MKYMYAHIEVKKDGKWLHYGSPNVDWDYTLYACINGTYKDKCKDKPY